MRALMMRVLPNWLTDLAVEFAGHWRISRAIDRAFAAGDVEALAVFRTGTFAALLTRRGQDARGEELMEYARLVVEKDGSGYRYRRMFADIDRQD